MWNKVADVAKHNNIPEANLVDFAISRDVKYGIIIEGGDAMVSNWYVTALIVEYWIFAREDLADIEQLSGAF